MKLVEITEFERIRDLQLDRDQCDVLLSSRADLELTPEPRSVDRWSLRANAQVGTVAAPGLILRIRPKVEIARLFVMLSAAAGSIKWDDRRVGLASSTTVEDVTALVLLDAISRALVAGVLRGYVEVEEESFFVRGRLDVAQTIRRRPALLAPFTQAPVLLEENIIENRVLRTAVAILSERVACPNVRARLLDVHRLFAGAEVLSPHMSLPHVARTRLNARWWPAIELALLVLRCCGLDLPSGVTAASTFLIDMNRVFEQFVFRSLETKLRRAGLELESNRVGLHLDEAKRHALRPDMSIWTGERCTFIGECKYKIIGNASAHRTDVYQCVAYISATGLESVMLVYAAGSARECDIRLVNGRTSVKVRTVDLAAPLDVLNGEFERLAREIQSDQQSASCNA